MDAVVDRLSLRRGAAIKSLDNRRHHFEPVTVDASNISHNLFEKLSLDGEELILNNEYTNTIGPDGVVNLNGDGSLEQPIRTIIVEVVGHKPTKLRGTIKVVGERANLVLINSRGINCDGCNFSNVAKVELGTGTIDAIVDGKIKWFSESCEEVRVEKGGMGNPDGAITIDARKIKITGDINASGDFILLSSSPPAKAEGDDNENKDEGTKSRGVAIDISGVKIDANKIILRTLGQGNIKISEGGNLGTLIASNDDLLMDAAGNINVVASMQSQGDVYIEGKNIVLANKTSGANVVESAIVSKKGLQISGNNIELQEGVKIKNEGGSLKIRGNKIWGAAKVEVAGNAAILSHGSIRIHSISSLGDISFVAKNDISAIGSISNNGGTIKIYGEKLDLGEIAGANNVYLHGKEIADGIKLHNVGNVEIVDIGKKSGKNAKDFKFVAPLQINGDFKFTGQNLNNHGLIRADNIALNLRGNFINGNNGEIFADGNFQWSGKEFTNYHRISVSDKLFLRGDSFTNDFGGEIIAGPIDAYLMGKINNGSAFMQRSNSTLESRRGGIELFVPSGGVYFEGKKGIDNTGDGASHGRSLVSTKLFSHDGDIHIFSGGDVVFDGVQTKGKLTVDAKGEIARKDLSVLENFPGS